MARTARERAVGQDWEATLSLRPQRVLTNDQVTMTVTLSAPDGRDLTVDDYTKFTYKFTADDPRLNAGVAGHAGTTVDGVPAFIADPFKIITPLPDGDYEINVKVTLAQNQ